MTVTHVFWFEVLRLVKVQAKYGKTIQKMGIIFHQYRMVISQEQRLQPASLIFI
jgi:hypothetical protein